MAKPLTTYISYTKRLIKKIVSKTRNVVNDKSDKTSFPNEPYRFTIQDAQTAYNIVLSNKLHHKVGHYVSTFEKEFAEYHQSSFALATNSGTSALELAFKAIGIQPGDEVIVPAYTFVATAQAVLSRGGTPVFADIDDTFTISPASVNRCITKKTKAIVPVHMFGNVADMNAIMKIAKKYKLRVIEDACQAIGALHGTQKVGSIGDIGCFSFDNQKAITTGQGGVFITNSKKYYDIAHNTLETGQLHDDSGSDVVTTGNNFAYTEISASLASSMLRQLDNLNACRKRNYDHFVNTFDATYLPIRWHRELPSVSPSYLRLIFLIDFNKLTITRAAFINKAQALGIPLKTFYPKPLYSYSIFRKKKDLLTGNNLPFTSGVARQNYEQYFASIFCDQQLGLNFSPYCTPGHMQYLAETIRSLLLEHLK